MIISSLLNGAQAESSCDLDSYLDQQCTELGTFNARVALGYGEKQNPYQYEDDIQLYILPDISFYYGHWFFDKDTLGYTLIDKPRYSLNLIGHLSSDSAYVHDYHLSNITSPVSSDSANSQPNDTTSPSDEEGFAPPPIVAQPEHDDIIQRIDIERDIAVHTALEFNYFTPHLTYRLQLSQDVSNVHDGFGLMAQVNYLTRLANWKVNARVGVKYKNEDWLDYYYGVSSKDTNASALHYQAKAGASAYIDLTLLYPINDDFALLGYAKYEQLSSEIHHSPLVDEQQLITWFSGVVYEF